MLDQVGSCRFNFDNASMLNKLIRFFLIIELFLYHVAALDEFFLDQPNPLDLMTSHFNLLLIKSFKYSGLLYFMFSSRNKGRLGLFTLIYGEKTLLKQLISLFTLLSI